MVSEAVNGEILEVQAVDITFYDAEGHEIEPATAIRVTMSPAATQHAEEATQVVHIDDQNAVEVIEQAKDAVSENATDVIFDADSFTVYAIVYTVDFEYEVDGNVYQYSIAGEGSIALSELIDILHINRTSYSTDEFLDHVENVVFSDPSLIELVRSGNDWVLNSLQPFNTFETLAVTMVDGQQFVVQVTDASQVNLQSIVAEGGIVTNFSASQSTTDVSRSGTISVHMEYTVDNDKLALARANNTWVYDLSEFFADPTVPFSGFPQGVEQSGPIIENNQTKGRYYIDGG